MGHLDRRMHWVCICGGLCLILRHGNWSIPAYFEESSFAGVRSCIGWKVPKHTRIWEEGNISIWRYGRFISSLVLPV
jgi:hypothetical protein